MQSAGSTPYLLPQLLKRATSGGSYNLDLVRFSAASRGTTYADTPGGSEFSTSSSSGDEEYFFTDEGEELIDSGNGFPSNTEEWPDYFHSINYFRSPNFLPPGTPIIVVSVESDGSDESSGTTETSSEGRPSSLSSGSSPSVSSSASPDLGASSSLSPSPSTFVSEVTSPNVVLRKISAGTKLDHGTRKSSAPYFFFLPSPSLRKGTAPARVQLRNLRMTPTVEEEEEEEEDEEEEKEVEEERVNVEAGIDGSRHTVESVGHKGRRHAHSVEDDIAQAFAKATVKTPNTDRYERAIYFAQVYADRNGGLNEGLRQLIELSSLEE